MTNDNAPDFASRLRELSAALRNRADRIAAVVEKAEAVRAALNAPWHSVPDMERVQHEAHESLFAALDALEGDAP